MPLVTVGIACFNAEDTIRRAVRGALSQDWPNLEVIVVDDASTDRSAAAARAEIGDSSMARLVRHTDNQGPAGSRNSVLAHAHGEFIAFMDDDDEALSSRVRAQVEALDSYEGRTGATLVSCHASGRRIYGNGYALDLPAIGSRGTEAPNGSAVADYLLFHRRRPGWFYGAGVPACSLLARRATFATVGGFDQRFRRVEDADFAIRLALNGGHFTGTREVHFVQYSTDAPDKSPEKNLAAEQFLAEKHKQYLDSIGRYQYAKRWPKLRYWHFKRNYRRFLMELTELTVRYPLAVPRHLLSTGPRRLIHEHRMGRPFAALKRLLPVRLKAAARRAVKLVKYRWRRHRIAGAISRGEQLKIIVGAAETHQDGWYSTNEDWLDIAKAEDWRAVFKGKRILTNVLAEHVFEHLTREECRTALAHINRHMETGGRIRAAVPDGNHPDGDYLRHVGIGGIGDDACDHKQLLTVDSLCTLMDEAGFAPFHVEGYDATGMLIREPWSAEDGFVQRSRANATPESRRRWSFIDADTSLIVDGVKT